MILLENIKISIAMIQKNSYNLKYLSPTEDTYTAITRKKSEYTEFSLDNETITIKDILPRGQAYKKL